MKPMLVAFALLVAINLVPCNLVPWAGDWVRVAAAEPDCPPGSEGVPCLAERGDPRAIYMMAHAAYEEGRNSGDMTLARELALKGVKTGDRSSKKLLKMLYLQLGEGVHRDYVQAYVWLTQAIADGNDYLRVWRDRLVAKMSTEQLAQARKRAGD